MFVSLLLSYQWVEKDNAKKISVKITAIKKIYGRDKSRTHDLSHAKGTRYQLRHTPIFLRIKYLFIYYTAFSFFY